MPKYDVTVEAVYYLVHEFDIDIEIEADNEEQAELKAVELAKAKNISEWNNLGISSDFNAETEDLSDFLATAQSEIEDEFVEGA